MYIENDIAYAGEKPKMLKVIGVKPLENYKLWLRFSTGETKIFDCSELLSYKAFEALRDIKVFNSVYLDYGVPVWNDGDIDIAPEHLYERSFLA